MPITRLIYISKASCNISEEEIREIAEGATARNMKLGLTGYLTLRHDQFLQYLEGNEESISEIWASIHEDSRHNIEQFWKYESDGPRYFPNWHMRYLKAEKAEKADDRLYDIIGRTFQAMRPPLRPEVGKLLDGLISEIAARTQP